VTPLLVVRHGTTAWNAQKRVQGRADVPLNDQGRAEIAALRLPAAFHGARAFTSPLARARETAKILGLGATLEAALIEMDWGRYEGRTLIELRASADFAANETRGLDFRPDGGESPRDVQARLRPWLARIAADAAPAVAVAHRGVIRALYALATDWDMTAKAPDKLDWKRGQVFNLQPDGVPRVARINVALDGS
jgi:probable phosphoglycerate mutase